MMEDVVNPAVPSTTGALLAEEWTINPLATLPSFLERFMMDEASRSAQKSLDAGIDLLQQKLEEQVASNQARTGTTTTTSLPFLLVMLRQCSRKLTLIAAKVVENFGPEISCLILYALERHCLRSEACATISESLYGGRQTKLDRTSNDRQRKLLPLSDRDKTRLALLVALGPYLRHRLLLWYQKLKQKQIQQALQQQQSPSSSAKFSLLQKLQKMFVWAYPLLHVSVSSVDLVYQWRYLMGHSVFFHPYAHFLGMIVRRVTQEDNKKKPVGNVPNSLNQRATNNPSSPSVGSPLEGSNDTSSSLRSAAVWGLSAAVIFSWVSHFRSEYQQQRQALIMEQQQNQQQNQQNSVNRQGSLQDITPPPPSSGIRNALPSHLCPLCRQPRVHPTASSSGFVFCYKCLLQHIQESGKCPVTGRDCREAQLLRLYEPNHSTQQL